MKAILIILFPMLLLAQEFLIQLGGSEPVVDPFTGEIYCRVFSEGIVKIRADGSGKVVNPFPHQKLPVFARKAHKAFYSRGIPNDGIEIYMVDFEQDTIFVLAKATHGLVESVSPNDKYIFLNGETAQYYSFEEDTVIDTGIKLYRYFDPTLDWINDSTIVYINDENLIIRFCFTQGILDTLIKLELGEYITGLAVNRKRNFIAYGYVGFASSDILLKFFFLNNGRDSIKFNFKWVNNLGGPWQYISLTWDSSFTRLAFLGDYSVGLIASDIFVHDIDQRKTFSYSDAHYGYKYFLNWISEDTVIYENLDKTGIYGFVLRTPVVESPVGIDNSPHPLVPEAFQLEVYPNPFNAATTIKIRNAPREGLKLAIYDTAGRLIYEKMARIPAGAEVTFRWNGNDRNNRPVASGVYFLTVSHLASNNPLTKPYKLVLIK